MKFNIITIFPSIFDSYFSESIIKRALEKKIININVVNLRDFTNDKHNSVDDTPFGGGAGMVMKVQPIYDCVEFLKSQPKAGPSLAEKSRIILFSAKGKRYTQEDAMRLSKYDNLIFICGRYEGVDERVAKYVADEEISFGDFVLSGGELAAMLTVDAVARLIPGFMSKAESIETKRIKITNQSDKKNKLPSYPAYTRPEVFHPNARNKKISWKVPEVLLSGHHEKIEKWRLKNKK